MDRREADALVRQMVVARTGESAVDEALANAGLNELEKQIFHVGSLLTGGAASSGNRVEVLSEGQLVYEALAEAIDKAEHHVHAVAGLSDRLAVLNFGRKIAEGRPAEALRDPAVVAAYLGDESKEEARA